MTEPSAPHVTARSDTGNITVELAARRTGMSFQRTRMSADRTLMSVIRTSLSLIGFGFTIFQVFTSAYEAQWLRDAAAARQFGIALVTLGIVMLIVGIGYHIAFMVGLRRQRNAMKADGLIHAQSHYPVSMTLLVAIVLLGIGIAAIASMVLNAGPLE